MAELNLTFAVAFSNNSLDLSQMQTLTAEYTAIFGKVLKGDPGVSGHTPVITGSKSGRVTTISSDGSPIATINDGEDSGICMHVEGEMLVFEETSHARVEGEMLIL